MTTFEIIVPLMALALAGAAMTAARYSALRVEADAHRKPLAK